MFNALFIKSIESFIVKARAHTCQIFYHEKLFFQVVQEYERAVIFRLGRLMQGGAKGPG